MRIIDTTPAVPARAMRSVRGISCAVAIAIAFSIPTIIAGAPSLAAEGNQDTRMTPSAPEAKPEAEPPKVLNGCSKAKQKRLAWLRKEIVRLNGEKERLKGEADEVKRKEAIRRNDERVLTVNEEMAQLQGQCPS